MTLAELTTSAQEFIKIGYWTAQCSCKKHSTMKWARVAPSDMAKVAFLIQADPFTEAGAKAINCNIMTRLV